MSKFDEQARQVLQRIANEADFMATRLDEILAEQKASRRLLERIAESIDRAAQPRPTEEGEAATP